MKKVKTQEIKDIVKELEKGNFKEAEIHNKVFRPWGNYFSVEEGLMLMENKKMMG